MRGPRVAAVQPPGRRVLGRPAAAAAAREQVCLGGVQRAVVEHPALPVVVVLAVHRAFFRVTSQIVH